MMLQLISASIQHSVTTLWYERNEQCPAQDLGALLPSPNADSGCWHWACWPRWVRAQCNNTPSFRSALVERTLDGSWPKWLRPVQHNTSSGSISFSACEKVGKWPLALDLLSKMAGSIVHQYTISCSILIGAVRNTQMPACLGPVGRDGRDG